MNGRDFSGTFATALGSNLTSAVGFNTVSLNSAAMLMRYFGVYPAQLTAANVVANIDPYMCARASVCLCRMRARKQSVAAADDALCSRRVPRRRPTGMASRLRLSPPRVWVTATPR